MNKIVVGYEKQVAEYVAKVLKLPHGAEGWGQYYALGVINGDKFLGGVVYNNYRTHDIEINAAFSDPRWATRPVLAALFAYPFLQLNCVRVTTIVTRKDIPVREFQKRLGFRQEGIIRKGFDGKQDAVIFGMLKTQCKWLNKVREHGKEIRTPSAAAA